MTAAALAGLVVLWLASAYLLGLGLVAVVKPALAHRFLAAFAQTRRADWIEAVVRGDRRTSQVIGRGLDELELPPATTIGGLVRGDKLLIAHHDVVIEPGDHVILFVMDKREMAKVSALFQTGATWL